MADKHIRILLVEDNPGDARLLQETLAEVDDTQFKFVHVDRLSMGLERLAEGGIDVVLLDLSLPDSQGFDTFVKLHSEAPDIPVVVLSGLDDETLAFEAVQKGAQDYLVKGQIVSNLMVRAIRYAMERHRMLAELEQARKKQLEMKDQLLSHVSHELRTPLTAIYQSVTLLLDEVAGEVNPEQREFLEISVRSAKQLGTMISDLLEATRADTGKLTVKPQRLNLEKLVAEVIGTFRGSAGEKQVDLCDELAHDLPYVQADPARVGQILTNLIGNALKFTTERGRITVSAKVLESDPSFVCVAVSDTGCGISPEGTKMIFDRLYQEENKIKDSRKGLGIGLYITKELVSRHGGRIWVDSNVGQGSTFYFTLPMFSLKNLLCTVVTQNERKKSIVLITVELDASDGRLEKEKLEFLIREARNVIERCILPDTDILLPRMIDLEQGEAFFIVACTDDGGASVIEQRVTDQLARCREIQDAGLVTAISRSVITLPPASNKRSLEQQVADVASAVEDLIYSKYYQKRVLIVDDEPRIVETIREGLMLGSPEYVVSSAKDGFEAGHKVATFRPHLVILDLKMPGLDGFEVCKRIKSERQNKDVKVIAITGFPGNGNKAKFLNYGADAFVAKPVEIDRLKALVSKVLA